MTLSEEARDRLADVVALQPTKNGELQEAWGMDSGSDVHGYLESELGEYYFRDDNSLIRATAEAADLVDVEPGVSGGEDGRPDRARLSELEARAFEVLAGPDERSESVVSVLHALRAAFDADPAAEDVRTALRSLVRSDLAETERRTVPTFRRTVAVDAVEITVDGDDGRAGGDGSTGDAGGETGDDEDVLDSIEDEVAEAASGADGE
jgi:hypothetical protein